MISNPLVKTPIKRILVLGCGGFIGSHFLDRLLTSRVEPERAPEVVGWDIADHKIAHLLDHPNLTFKKQGVDARAAQSELAGDIENADIVVNLAAICNPSQYNTEPVRTIYANFIDSYPIFEIAAAKGTPLIHFSTSEVYGRTIASYLQGGSYGDPDLFQLDTETTPLIMGPVANQRWTYACAKQLGERLIFALNAERGLPFAIIRPFNFFGPRMDYLPGLEGEGKPRVLPIFMANILLGKPLELVDGGKAKRTITSIHDAVDALMAIIEKPQERLNQIYNIGNPDNEISMADLAQMMREVMTEVSGDPTYLQHPIHNVSGEAFYGPGYEDCDRRIMDIAKERRLLDWNPRITVRDVLRETARHYLNLYGDRRTAAATAAE